MLKKIKAAISEWLLKVDWIKLEVEAYKNVQQKKRDDQLFAKLVLIGGTVHDHEPTVKSHKTLATVCDRGVFVEYMDGRMIGQRCVTPIFIDSTNWGVGKSEDPLLHVCNSNRNNVESSNSEGNGRTNVNYAGIYAKTNAISGPSEAEPA